MPYLTEEEYKDMGFAEIASPFSFDNLLIKASALLDTITLSYYQYRDLNSDTKYMQQRFKSALACQIEHFQTVKATSSTALNNKPTSVSMGRTSISYGSKGNGDSKANKIVSEDVYLYLSGTGLLSRGACR